MTFQFLLLAGNVAGLGVTGLGIDYIAHQIDPAHAAPHWPLHFAPPPAWSSMGVVSLLAAAVLALAFARAWLDFSYQVSLAQLVQGQIVVELRARVYDKLQRLSFRFFDAHASGSIINRVTSDVQNLRSFVDLVLIPDPDPGFAARVGHGLHGDHPRAPDAGVSVLQLLCSGRARSGSRAWCGRRTCANRELLDHLIDVLSENVQGAQVVKGFAREQEQIRKFAVANDAVRDQQVWIFWRLSTFVPIIGFAEPDQPGRPAGLRRIARDPRPTAVGLGVGRFRGAVAAVFQSGFSRLGHRQLACRQVSPARAAFSRVLDTPVEIASPPPARAIRLPKARGEVRFENVWFDYQAEHSVLRGVDFRIEPGCCVAILGPTGAGKSALLGSDPTVLRSERRLRPDRWAGLAHLSTWMILRRNIGLVFQESFLFSNTIAANIAFGHPAATHAQIERAARLASAHDFIMALPAGYASVLGEGASNLSGGQRQRLAIARALLLEPPILLLDDPTAAVDPGTEHEILRALDGAMAGRTTFLVAHRISTLERADLVMVLKEGKVVEIGPPRDLLAQGSGHYRQVANLQVADEASKAALARDLAERALT